MITLNSDGYVRLTPATLESVNLVHLWSGVDDHDTVAQVKGEAIDSITGLTEWVSDCKPAISIGWDWRLDAAKGSAQFIMLGMPRTNVMLVDQANRDLGADQTAALLLRALQRLDWPSALISYINSATL